MQGAREREVWNKRHENVRAQMAAVVERTLEEKRKLQLQKDRSARQHSKARRQSQLDLGAARLAGNPKRARREAAPATAQDHSHLIDADQGEYLDHKHKEMMLAVPPAVVSPSSTIEPWRPAGGSPRPEDRRPSATSRRSAAILMQTMRHAFVGTRRDCSRCHNRSASLTVASLTGESMSRHGGVSAETTATLATSAILDQLEEEDRLDIVRALAKIRTQFELRGGRQFADTRGFDGREMSPEEFRDQLRIQLSIRFSRRLVKKLFDLFDRDKSGYLSWIELLPKLYGNMDTQSCLRP